MKPRWPRRANSSTPGTKDVELAAHDLLQYLDTKTGLEPTRRRTLSKNRRRLVRRAVDERPFWWSCRESNPPKTAVELRKRARKCSKVFEATWENTGRH
jgi:hypothetical protein